MIKVKRDANLITIKGHAEYSNGNDIVCASASSIMYTTVNAILRLNKKGIDYQDDGNVVKIKVLDESEYTNVLITNMLSLLAELASKYPKNIQIESEE